MRLTLVALVLFAVCVVSAQGLDDEFRNPPHAAQPWVYWDVLDGHFTREGITADLESMKSAGIGGVIQMHIGGHVPLGEVEFMGDTWRSNFVHAVLECERLGLEFTTITGPGWTGSGGPWIKVDQSMQHLVHAGVNIEGPAEFNQVLPKPPLHFTVSENKHNDRMRKDLAEFYEDVAVYAFPHREPVIEDVDEKALYLRRPYTSMEGVRTHLPSPVSFPEPDKSKVIEPGEIIDLTNHLQADGRLQWDVPAGEWTILRMGRRSTGSNTRPAPEAGLGFESNKFDKAALNTHFESYFDPLLEKIGPRPKSRTKGFTGLDADSWEMGAQNWTPGFREEFKKRRGYDGWDYFPVYSGRVIGSREISERFLWDVRMTCQEVLLDNHMGHMKKLCQERGLKLSIEPYDMTPTNDLDLGSFADIPMGEFWHEGYNSAWSCIEAASIGHVMGKPVVASESFTSSGTWWRKSPSMIKDQANWALAAGINRFVIHGFAHQPWLDRSPGMIMGGWGLNWARTQTFWPMVDAFHLYLARCSHMLQQGVSVVDILYLTPEGAPHVFRAPESALHDALGRLPDKKGYGFDACSPRMLMKRAEVKEGFITFPGGSSYRLMVLPEFETMTPELLEKIAELVKAGATIIGSPSVSSPSLKDYPQCDDKLEEESMELWGSVERPEKMTRRKYGRGAIYWGGVKPDGLYPGYNTTARLMKQMGVSEDFTCTGPVRYTHRTTGLQEIYFVSNRSGDAIQAECTFRVDKGEPQLWDPVTGKTRELPDYKLTDGLTTIPLEFFPHESYFVIFPRKDPESPVSAEKDNFPDASPVTTLDGSWQVSFDPEWGGPEMVMFDGLYDWSMSKNDEIKYYSGIATYRKAFDRPESLKDDSEVWLDLGTVHEIARVRLNGKELGVVWSAPWRIDISAALKPGSNTLEIELANLWPNRLIGDAGKPEDQQFTWTVRHHYTSKSELMPSGLLGPVRLLEAGEKEERNDAVNHILSLRDKSLKNGAFDIEYFSSDDHFPYATDWMYQDMKEKIHLWFAEDDNSEIKDEVIDKFKPVLGDHIESGYEKLKKGGKISDKDWLIYYFDLCQERRAIRLATIPEKYRKLVFTKHFDLGGSHYAYTENPTDAPGSEKSCDHPDYKKGSSLCIFTLDGTYGKTEVIESTESGVIRDPDVSYDGKTILYSKRESRDQDDYHIYEYDVEAKTSRQLTFGLGFADVEPAYLPNGNIIFNSTRCVQTVDCFWPDVTNLYLSDADGNHIRRVGYDQVHTNYPKVMDNGKVIYTRWDYNDRAQIFPQPLFEMNMDGTRQTEYYGNNSFFPTAILHARGLPGTNKVLAVLGGHHAHPRGKLAVIDPSKGRQEADGVQLVAPIRKAEAERVDAYGQDGDQFQFPYPIDNENFFITYCAYHGGNRNYPRPYGIYWMNMDGERELLVWDAKVSCNQQMPLASRIKPPERPSLVDYTKKTGIYHVKNVYEGPGLEGIEKGTVKELRVVEILYRQAAIGLVFNGRGPGGAGHSMMPVAARHGTWDAKKVWGSVPVYEDGSSLFEVPARTPFYFQLIDSLGDVVQTMRSWSTLQPGEIFSCVGCHEDPNSAPVMGGLTLADKMGVQKLKPFYDVEGGFSFNRVIQPILDDKCISCHDGKKHEDKYLFSLTSEQYVPGPNLRQFGTDSRRIWSASYMNLTSGGIVHPKETVLGWLDVMETPAMLKPYYAGSAKSRMMKMLRKGHSGVTLSREELDKFACWIDLLVPYCGDYDENTNWTTEDWKSYKYFTSKRQLSKMEDAKNVRSYIEAQHNSKPKTRTIDKTYRNLALNPSDTQWFNLLFPHATSNSECRGEDAFLAKNAINGLKENKGHGGEHPSWGPEKTSDIWWKVDFGKEVLTDKLVLYIRADFPHDKYWNEARIEFSDGSSQKIEIGKTEKAQVFKFTGGKKKTSWVKLSGFKQTEPIGWCGLTEVEVWGWNENNDLLTNN